jgi:hypothetical protein
MLRAPIDFAPVGVAILVGVPLGVLWVMALTDLVRRAEWEFPGWQPGSNDRIMWTVVVLLLNGFGALLYYFMVMREYPRGRR